MRVFVTISKDDVNTVSYTIVEHRFGAASLCENLMLFSGISVMTWNNQPF